MSNDMNRAQTMTGRILVLDDDLDVCQLPHNCSASCRVDVAMSEWTALNLLGRNSYDLALLNLQRCYDHGLMLYRGIRSLNSRTIAIIISDCRGNRTATEAVNAGAWEIVCTPLNIADLMYLLGTAPDRQTVLVVESESELCATLTDTLLTHFRQCSMELGELPEVGAPKLPNCIIVRVDREPHRKRTAIQICRKLHQSNPTKRILLIADNHAGTMRQIVHELLSSGVDAVCYKPFGVEHSAGIGPQLMKGAS